MAFGHRTHINDPIGPVHVVLGALIMVVGAGLRFQAAQGDLWLDEIWSLNLAATVNVWHEVFWKVIHDNNHPLNTLYLYFVGPNQEPWVHRLPAIVAGTLSILAAGWAVGRDEGGRYDAGRALMAMGLVAVLYPLVHFGSEARGYGLMTLFAFVAFGAVDRACTPLYSHAHPPQSARWLFAFAVTLGTVSHLSILPVAFMMCVALMLRHWRAGTTLGAALGETLQFVAPVSGGLAVVAGAIGYGFTILNGREWYGGRAAFCPPEGCFVAALDNIVRFSSGGFGEGLPGLHTGLFAILIIGAVLWLLALGRNRALLYGAVLIGTPLIYLALGQPNVPYGRYFLAVLAFAPLILADVMAELRARSKLGRWGATVALVAIVTANAWALTRFYEFGRGHYTEAFTLIMDNTPGPVVRIGSDMLFRLTKVFDYIERREKTDKTIEYVASGDIVQKRPDWVVTVLVNPHDMRSEVCMEDEEGDLQPVTYRLDGVFPFWGLRGVHWGLYRRVPTTLQGCP